MGEAPVGSAWLPSLRNHLGCAGAAAVTAHDGSHGDVGPLLEAHAVGVFSEGGRLVCTRVSAQATQGFK